MWLIQVRIQTSNYASTLRECFPKMQAEEGTGTFFKGLKPLWMRQIPYTMMKFACFEKTVVALYTHVVPKPRDQCNQSEQLMVTFAAGYIAGVFCAIVSHPADSVVSVINKNPTKGAGESKFKLIFSVITATYILTWNPFTNFIFSLERIGTKGCLEGTWSTYHYDWYLDCPPMVHLRWCQSRTQFATTATTTDARITQKEAQKLKYSKNSNILNLAVRKLALCQRINKKRFTSSTSLF